MTRRPPEPTRTYTPFPYTTLLRSPAGGRVMKESFGWIDNYRMVSEDRGGRKVVLGVEITLNEWSYKALVEDRRILTVNKQYFDLTGGIERRQIGRAHVELQSLMRISYAVFCLKKKTTTAYML